MKLYDEAGKSLAESEIKEEIQEAFEFAIASPDPEEKDLYTHVYSQ
jgi:TPP-dependent pyruvate/acetoin dehydrogenase alpha subunit